MRAVIRRSQNMVGVLRYLQGPGAGGVHTNPHVLAARGGAVERFVWSLDGGVRVLSAADARVIGYELDEPHAVHGVPVPWVDRRRKGAAVARGCTAAQAREVARVEDASVWHCSLTLDAGADPLGDDRWASIAEEFMREMGFESSGAGVRWVAIAHGLSVHGEDHIHVVASLVCEDGSVVQLFRAPGPGRRPVGDGQRCQHVVKVLEDRYCGAATGRRGEGAGAVR